MKNLMVITVVLLSGLAAQAKSVFVSSNVYLASGPATAQYFVNLGKINSELKKVSDANLGSLSFNGAQVLLDENKVKYYFHKFIETEIENETCWVNLSFKTEDGKQGPLVSDIKATLDCQIVRD